MPQDSRRGIDFLNDWIAEHLPETFIEDPAAIMDLADQLLLAAEKQGVISTGYLRRGRQPLPRSFSKRCKTDPEGGSTAAAGANKAVPRTTKDTYATQRTAGNVPSRISGGTRGWTFDVKRALTSGYAGELRYELRIDEELAGKTDAEPKPTIELKLHKR
ncbi:MULTISPECIES: hypothetical protein [unclassified Mesorhizobium]|uniref:hypothetical protein n=1 Tax=unclassified Mesorhizobium TaxID=325217 RepID=UPI001FDF1490|nr:MULTISPECIES: hypothetical protein [unclassified Mesorhizobium]